MELVWCHMGGLLLPKEEKESCKLFSKTKHKTQETRTVSGLCILQTIDTKKYLLIPNNMELLTKRAM